MSPLWPSSQPGRFDLFGTGKLCLSILLIAIPSFFLGTTISLYTGVDCLSHSPPLNASLNEEVVERRVKELVRKQEEALLAKHTELVNKLVQAGVEEECNKKSGATMLDSHAVGSMVAGMSLTPKSNFTDSIDLGVPLDNIKDGSNHVLILYGSHNSMPTSLRPLCKKQTFAPKLSYIEAVENCDEMKVLLVDYSANARKQCLALVPQYESFYLQTWMRVPEARSVFDHGKIDNSQPLRLVSRGLLSSGYEEFRAPTRFNYNQTFEGLRTYLNSLDQVLAELRDVVINDVKPYGNKTIIVMVCNFGQSELLMNFVCHAKSKNLDTSSVLVFATDHDTEVLAKALGLAVYNDKHNFANIPKEAARHYGDGRFGHMMMAKVLCVQLIAHLGYDLLFQDVDILWYQHPLSDYFAKPGHWSQKYDVIFQDDGGHSVRYSPYSANSGFYFVRNNRLTRHFLNTLLTSSATVLESGSHQQVMISVLSEHVSLYALRVKVVSRDSDDMPGGYQWHMKSGKYMRAFFRGEKKPLIFHMSWTANKDNKIKFFQQMGAWHAEEKCIGERSYEILNSSDNLLTTCCSGTAIFKCHYKDKPSIHPCKDSPNIDVGRASFW